MNPIDLSCKVTSTTSNEVIPPQTTEVTSTSLMRPAHLTAHITTKLELTQT